MDSSTVGAIATIAAVIIAHVLSQRAGESRANHVREELINRIDSLDRRITESRDDLKERIVDLKHDLKELKSDILNALPSRARGAGGESQS
jgi:endonuclease III